MLAWLRPQIGQREAAKRRAEVADLDQKLVMDNLNVERLALQGAVNPDNQVATGNIYFEEAQTRRDAERKQRELIAESLKDRAAVRAQVSGRVLAAAARAGEVVAAGRRPVPARRSAQAAAGGVELRPAARRQPALRQPERRLGAAGIPRAGAAGRRAGLAPVVRPRERRDGVPPGQLVEIEVRPAADFGSAGRKTCAVGPGGGTVVWIRSAPERLAERKVTDCDAPLQLAAGERLVTQGAALLSQYH